MFTVKFLSTYDDSSWYEQSISCPNYSIYHHPSGHATVTTYKDHLDVSGVERKIMIDADGENYGRQYFHEVYVENSSGKTINRFIAEEHPANKRSV